MRAAAVRGSREGMALVLTLMVLAIVTAMVVEFAYGVYVNTSLLYNWQASQRLSLLGSSGASIAGRFVTETVSRTNYTYPGSVALPPQDPFKEGTFVSVVVEDENAKFNLNTLVSQNGKVNEEAHESFKRLLDALTLEEDIADLIADWMDSDSLPMPAGSERRAKNAHLDSIEEIILIKGIDRKVYDKLLPYITIYGGGALGDGPVNINSAEVPVLMSLSEEITSEMAQRVIDYRKTTPFEKTGNVYNVAGFEGLSNPLKGITVKSNAFRITVTASLEDGLGRTIECVIDTAGVVNYWKES